MKEGQLCRLKKNTRLARTHGYLWVYVENRVYVENPAPARNWGYFTSVATGVTATFNKAMMEPADET
jgi:hypothetical protein